MTYVAVADPLLNSGKPGRATDVKQMRDNQADHETRILSLEDINNVRIASHFAKNHGYASNQVLTGAALSTILRDYDRDWYLEVAAGNGIVTEFPGGSETSDDHYLRITQNGMIVGSLSLMFDLRVKPLTYIARCRQNDRNEDLIVGFSQFPSIGTLRPTSGCWLEKSAATTMRFAHASASAYVDGTNTFASPVNNTWFEVKIIFTDTPSDRFLCYFDNVLKETFTTAASLPTARNIFGMVKGTGGATDTLSIDRLDIYAGGPIVDIV